MAQARKFNKMMLLFPPGKVYVYPDGSPGARKHCSIPIGIAYLAANLRKYGYEACILDILVEGYSHEVYKEPFIVYGLPTEDVIARIRIEKPDIIGFSLMFSMLAEEAYAICAAIKEAFPDLPIVMGGQHASGAPFDVMKRESINYILHGEADNTIVHLMDALNGLRPMDSVRGLYYRHPNGRIADTMSVAKAAVEGKGWNYYDRRESPVPSDLDGLPYPAFDLMNMNAYWGAAVRTGGGDAIGERFGVMLASRGCPHVCTFCTSPLQSGYRFYRKREIKSVLDEIRWQVETFGVSEIQFVEDNFFVSKKYVKDLMRALAKEFPDIVFWNTSGVDVNALDKEMIDLMVDANFHRALLAIEAGDPKVQAERVDKKVKLERLPDLVEYMKDRGIDLKALYMIGFPGETRAQIQRTVDFALNLGILDFNLSIVSPLPGTPLYDECLEKGLFIEGTTLSNICFGKSVIKLPDTTPEELEDIRRLVWRQAFEKRIVIEEQERARLKAGIDTDVMHRYRSVGEYETLGFKTKPPPRGNSYAIN